MFNGKKFVWYNLCFNIRVKMMLYILNIYYKISVYNILIYMYIVLFLVIIFYVYELICNFWGWGRLRVECEWLGYFVIWIVVCRFFSREVI